MADGASGSRPGTGPAAAGTGTGTDGRMGQPGATASGLSLALLVAGLSLPLLWRGAGLPEGGHPARLAELLLPGLFAPLQGVSPDTAAPTSAWLDGRLGPWSAAGRLHVGLLPLLLALLGALVRPRVALGLTVTGLVGILAMDAWPALVGGGLAPTLLVLGLAWLAGLGLTRGLVRPSPGQELVVGSLAVLGSGATAAWALGAGAATDAEALARFTAPGDPALAAAAAEGLRVALDAGALAAFAAMSTLLLLLRWRGTASAVLVLCVAGAELALAHGWWGPLA